MKYFGLGALFFLLTTISKATHAQTHTELWDTYMSKFGDKPASILVDMGFNETAPDKRYPYLVITGPHAHNTDKKGLPDKEEIIALEDILDVTGNFITGITLKLLAGTVTYNGERLNYYYVKDTAGIRNAVARMYKRNYPGYKFALSIKPDPQWLIYSTFLYPSEEMQNWMDNNKIITRLLQSGDSLTKPRNIVYAVCFKADSSRSAFISFATGKGYSIQKSPTIKNSEYPECLIFSKQGYIKKDSVNTVTATIKEEVKKHNGVYNGWNAPLR